MVLSATECIVGPIFVILELTHFTSSVMFFKLRVHQVASSVFAKECNLCEWFGQRISI